MDPEPRARPSVNVKGSDETGDWLVLATDAGFVNRSVSGIVRGGGLRSVGDGRLVCGEERQLG